MSIINSIHKGFNIEDKSGDRYSLVGFFYVEFKIFTAWVDIAIVVSILADFTHNTLMRDRTRLLRSWTRDDR